MSRKKVEYKYHFIYKTTNLKNGKYYLGMHSTSNLNDGYLGSGKILWHSINYHGRENFKFEIIEYLENRQLLANREKELVNDDILKDPMCMNLRRGGEGAWHKLANDAFKENLKDPEYKNEFFKKTGLYKYNELGLNKTWKDNYDWLGKNHTEEAKNKIGSANSINQKGENNSQFGTFWITNGIENKKIKIDSSIPNGWHKGRIFKEDFSNNVAIGMIGKSTGKASTEEKEIERRKKIAATMKKLKS